MGFLSFWYHISKFALSKYYIYFQTYNLKKNLFILFKKIFFYYNNNNNNIIIIIIKDLS